MGWPKLNFQDIIKPASALGMMNGVTAPAAFLGSQYASSQDAAAAAQKSKDSLNDSANDIQNTTEQTYGQGAGTTGQDVQRLKGIIQQRTDQTDPISEAIRNSKGGAVATAQREMAKQGVKGGVAAQATDQIARQRDADIASSLYGQRANSIDSERSLIGNIASSTAASKMTAEQLRASQNIPKQAGILDNINPMNLFKF